MTLIYIVSNIDKSLGLEWTARELNKRNIKMFWILLNPQNSELEKYLTEQNIPLQRITYFGKKSMFNAIWSIFKILRSHKPCIVHCHLFDASIAGLIAANLAEVKKRIVTRHHSTFHHEYFPRAVFYDRIINSLSTNIIAVSENVRKVLITKENVPSEKILVCPHGFDFNYFLDVDQNTIEELKSKYGLQDHYPIIGVISDTKSLKAFIM